MFRHPEYHDEKIIRQNWKPPPKTSWLDVLHGIKHLILLGLISLFIVCALSFVFRAQAQEPGQPQGPQPEGEGDGDYRPQGTREERFCALIGALNSPTIMSDGFAGDAICGLAIISIETRRNAEREDCYNNKRQTHYWSASDGTCQLRRHIREANEADRRAREAADEARRLCELRNNCPTVVPDHPGRRCRDGTHHDGHAVSNDCGLGRHITPTPVPRLIVGPAPIAPADRREVLRQGRQGNDDDDDDEDGQEDLDRRIREGAARGRDVDKEKNEYRRRFGNPCRWVNGRVVCVH